MIREGKIILVTFFVLAFVGCAGSFNKPKTVSQRYSFLKKPLKVIDAKTKETILEDAAFRRLREAKVVFVAEEHDNVDHHAIESAIIRQIYEANGKVAIGMEMFQYPFQDVLNEWVQSQIDEVYLLQKTEYRQRWGYDFSLYRPIFEFARSNEIPVIALDERSEIIKKISQNGLAQIEDKEKLPNILNINDRYKKYLKAEIKKHHPLSDENLEKFYEAQMIRDLRIAERISRYLDEHSEITTLVVMIGQKHVESQFGLPLFLKYHGIKKIEVVFPMNEKEFNNEKILGTMQWIYPEIKD